MKCFPRRRRWTSQRRRYSQQPETLAYLRDAAARDGLLDLVVTGQDVVEVVLDEAAATWTVRTRAGQAYEADVVVSAVGQLSNPVVPPLAGVEDFAGPSFHSAHWRHDVDLTGKRVAVVGTGASAIQLVPGIVDEVASMTVFQRSAPYVVPKPDQAYGPRYRRAFESRPRTLSLERDVVFWLSERLNLALGGQSRTSRPMLAAVRGVWRLHLRRQVRDATLRSRLAPDYRRRPARGRRPGLGHRLRRHAIPRWDQGGRRSRRRATGRGPRAPGPTSASRSRASRTCSASTGPTPTSVAARSSP